MTKHALTDFNTDARYFHHDTKRPFHESTGLGHFPSQAVYRRAKAVANTGEGDRAIASDNLDETRDLQR
jgi:hypothetical protein